MVKRIEIPSKVSIAQSAGCSENSRQESAEAGLRRK